MPSPQKKIFFEDFLTERIAVSGTWSNLAEFCLQKTHIFYESYDILPPLKSQKYPYKKVFYIGNNFNFAPFGTKLLFEVLKGHLIAKNPMKTDIMLKKYTT